MGRHKEWRKVAKRERRRRIRTQQAKLRDDMDETDNLISSDQLYEFEVEQIRIVNDIENEKWLQAERYALEQWRILQKKIELLQMEKIAEEARLKLEREQENQRKRDEEKRLKEIEEENIKKQQMFMEKLEIYFSGNSDEPPKELLILRETRPNLETCPFFEKTGCCRFSDQCSRNHCYPGISKVLLATNFYRHFGLVHASHHQHEYDTDIMLEYDDSDTYKEFVEFFYDVLPEFERFGRIVQFKVCNNYEKHLRGNTYIEFSEVRDAVAAYRSLHARWYGGRQLSLQFCRIKTWRKAICGLQTSGRCPKGRSCNYLHVFRNPDNLYPISVDLDRMKPRSWRWSESPEKDSPRYKTSNEERRHDKDRRRKRYDDQRYQRRSKKSYK